MPVITNAKTIQTKSRAHTVEPTGPQSYTVVSGASGNTYRIWVGPENRATCSCSWGQYRRTGAGSACSHVIAVQQFIAAQQGRRVSAWADAESAKRQKRSMLDIGDGVILTTRAA
jgi:hypothetical protein